MSFEFDRTPTQMPLSPDEVRIDVAYTGICGTDLHILHGHMDARVTYPAVIGHEMSGVISETGSAVTNLHRGDHVSVIPLRWCGNCAACRAGYSHICSRLDFIGIDSEGSMQTQWVVPADLIIPLPAELDLRLAALVEPTAVAVHDVARAELKPNESALIVGGGPVGLLIALVARHVGVAVTVMEPNRGRRDVARSLGFAVLDPTDQSAANPTDDPSDFDVVFEVSGSEAGVVAAVSKLAVRGRLVVVGIHPQPRPMDLHRIFWRELTIVGARVYTRRDFERAAEHLTAGVVPSSSLITGVLPLAKVGDAFAGLESGHHLKVLIDCREDKP